MIIGIALKSSGGLRLWAPVIGVVAGSVVAAAFGLYDVDQVVEARWIGLPDGGWPGFDTSFGSAFWSFLPAFVLVTIIGAVETIGDSVAIQRVSWRQPRAVDYRVVQGAVAADGTGNLLSGLAGTVPNTTYSTSRLDHRVDRRGGPAGRCCHRCLLRRDGPPSQVPRAGARNSGRGGRGVRHGADSSLLFVVGMRIVAEEAADYRKGLIAGVSFWVGVGFQGNLIFGEYLEGFAGGFLENGMTAGGLTGDPADPVHGGDPSPSASAAHRPGVVGAAAHPEVPR